MTPLDIMINQANEKSTAIYEFCKSRASRMTLDALSLLSSEYDFGYDVEEKSFEISLRIPAEKLISDQLERLRCDDCPRFREGESKTSILSDVAYYYCPVVNNWVCYANSCDYVKRLFV